MWKYFKAAFWARPRIPGVGDVPVNALAVAGLAILGFGHPGFWLLGLALEGVYLWGVSSHPRFQRLIDAEARATPDPDLQEEWKKMVLRLDTESAGQLERLERRAARVIEMHRQAGAEIWLVDSNAEALRNLSWQYLKLLNARQILLSVMKDISDETFVRKQITGLEKELENPRLTESLRESKSATRRLLEQRLGAYQERRQMLDQVESDLRRIEAQVDLAFDHASVSGKPEAVSANLNLASHMLDQSIFGEEYGAISAMERQYGRESE
jgi:hypothetical protein